jgi:membrane protein required for colicin V production
MNWLDILLAVILLFSFAGALWNGITREVVRIIALLGGIFGGMWWYTDLIPHIAPYVGDESVASFAAFGVIVVGSLIAGGAIAWLLAKVLHWSGLRWFDRVLGGAFGLMRGLIMATAIVLAVVAFAPTTGSSETVAQSRIAPLVLHSARWTAALAPPDLRTSFYSGFDRVRNTWTASDSIPETAPATKALVKSTPLSSR